MLRLALVIGIIVVGGIAALKGGAFPTLLFYLWYAYFRPEQWVWSDVITALNLSLLSGIWLLIAALPRLYKFRWTTQSLLMAAMLAQSTLSLILAQYFDAAFAPWIEFLKVLIVAGLITFLVQDEAKLRLTFLVIVYSLGFEAAKQGWAQLVLNPGGQNNNSHPILGDNNGVAVGMMMLFPLAVALARTAKTKREAWIHWVFAIGFLYRGLSTYSRGGFLAAAAAIVMTTWQSKHRLRVLGGLLVVGISLSSVMPDAFWRRMETIVTAADERDSSAAGRLFFWGVALRMAESRPLTGVGFRGYSRNYNQYDPSYGANGQNRAVHSAWFGVLAELGYPGLFIFVAVVGSSFMASTRAYRLARARPETSNMAAYASAIRTSIVAYAVGMTFLNGQYNEMFWHLVGLSATLPVILASRTQTIVTPPVETERVVSRVPQFQPRGRVARR